MSVPATIPPSPPEGFARCARCRPASAPSRPRAARGRTRRASASSRTSSSRCFIAQMLRQMRQSMTMMGDEEQGEGAKTFGAMTDTVDGELARQLSEAGGMGIADVIIESFERQRQAAATPPIEPGTPLSLTTPPAPAVPIERPPVSLPAASSGGALAPRDGVGGASAAAGRRRCAANGADDHVGVRLAPRPLYRGKQVPPGRGCPGRLRPACPGRGDGQVVSAGPAGGYGLSVVIEHGFWHQDPVCPPVRGECQGRATSLNGGRTSAGPGRAAGPPGPTCTSRSWRMAGR